MCVIPCLATKEIKLAAISSLYRLYIRRRQVLFIAFCRSYHSNVDKKVVLLDLTCVVENPLLASILIAGILAVARIPTDTHTSKTG